MKMFVVFDEKNNEYAKLTNSYWCNSSWSKDINDSRLYKRRCDAGNSIAEHRGKFISLNPTEYTFEGRSPVVKEVEVHLKLVE